MGIAAAVAAAKVYPNRWVRVRSNLREDSDIERIRAIADVAAKHGLTGIALSAGLDSLDLKPPEYFDRLKKVRALCEERDLEIIPSFMSSGYGGAVLAHDKNLAAGLEVKEALFEVRDGRATLKPEPAVSIANSSFEQAGQTQPPGFEVPAESTSSIVLDEKVAHQGTRSVRFENLERIERGHAQFSQTVQVHPFRQYRLTCRVKTENLGASDPFGSGNFVLEVLGGEEERRLQYQNPRLSSDDEWSQVAVGFNSWEYESVKIIPRVRGGISGRLWVDDLELEEVGLVNLLRRPGTPVSVKSDQSDVLYEEGRDYAPIADPDLNFRYDHEGPSIQILPGSRIKEGERLRVGYYHGTNIYNGQTPICMSEPKLYEVWETQVKLVHQHLAPAKYMLNMDEVRTGGSCVACKSRGLSLAQILGDSITRQYEMIKQVNPEAEIFVWSDMLDPNHNANPEREYYYLAQGNYAGSWNYIPKDLRIICWYFNRRVPSLAHFSSLGHQTVAGAYYDADDLENVKGWLEALDDTPGAIGILYTTWLDKYDLLDEFGDLASTERTNPGSTGRPAN